MNTGNLKLRRCSYTFCTSPKIIFFGSALLKLPFDILFWYKHGTMAIKSPKFSEICNLGPIWRHINTGNLKPRRGLYPYCTNPMIIFLCSASLKLPFDINIVLVQTWYQDDRKPRIFGKLHCRTCMATHECR